MNKKILLSLFLLTTIIGNSQITIFKRLANDSINRWSFDVNVGQAKGVTPYQNGYYSSNPNQYFGSFSVNHINIAGRYMFSPKMGLKFGLGFDQVKNNSNTPSLPFKMNVYTLSTEAVVNLIRLMDIQKSMGNIGLLFHGGIQINSMTPSISNPAVGQNNKVTEYNGGFLFGITPTYKITDRIALTADLSFTSNYRQHLSWDGFYANENQNLSGSMISYSGGMSFSIGQDDVHGDWAEIKNAKSEKELELEKRVGEMETLMNDTDKDGVPDYLDQENNSTAGVTVDSRGKMVDLNKNGVPDEMERYLDSKYSNKTNETAAGPDMVTKYINDGYVAAYFDTRNAIPTNVSTQGINFMLTYLKNNPTKSVNIFGHADEIGKSESNDTLSMKRAENVKQILIKAGIAPERLNVKSNGEDASVDKDSEGARRLVRKVTFSVQ